MSGKTQCMYRDDYFDLPVYIVVVGTVDSAFAHEICGILINQDTTDHNSWIYFQYSNHNIKLGDWQIPVDDYDIQMLICKVSKVIMLGTTSKSVKFTFKFY